MATSSAPHQSTWTAEEIGFQAGGPGRAAEAALARLMDGGHVRMSREGLVTAVHQNGYGATTAIEAFILAGLSSSTCSSSSCSSNSCNSSSSCRSSSSSSSCSSSSSG